MANGVRHGRFKLGQALHGYADGHRQLSRSIEISPTDARAMLALSDVAGPGLQIGPDGYLTGYPLSRSLAFMYWRRHGQRQKCPDRGVCGPIPS